MNMKKLVGVVGMLMSSLFLSAKAEIIPGTKLSINFESANIVGSGRHLNMQRVPVINIDTGNITLYDASFKFTFLPEEGLIFEQITSASVSPPTSIANITPGIYSADASACYILEGPTAVNSSRSIYTIRGYQGEAPCTRPINFFTAQIISGTASGHPDIGTRDIVPNLTDTYVYGFVASSASNCCGHITVNFNSNELIGVRQSGNQLIIGLFSEEGNDFVDPRETAILTKIVTTQPD